MYKLQNQNQIEMTLKMVKNFNLLMQGIRSAVQKSQITVDM